MGSAYHLHITARLGQRDVEDSIAVLNSFEKVLKANGGFSRAGSSLEEIEAPSKKSPFKDGV
jgi:hypothetical protein